MSSSPTVNQSCDVRAPVVGGTNGAAPQQLAGTGGTGVESTALRGGEVATLLNGATAIRFRMGTGAIEAATTDPILGPYGRFDWFVTTGVDDIVSIEAADGAATFEAHVWTSSGPR